MTDKPRPPVPRRPAAPPQAVQPKSPQATPVQTSAPKPPRPPVPVRPAKPAAATPPAPPARPHLSVVPDAPAPEAPPVWMVKKIAPPLNLTGPVPPPPRHPTPAGLRRVEGTTRIFTPIMEPEQEESIAFAPTEQISPEIARQVRQQPGMAVRFITPRIPEPEPEQAAPETKASGGWQCVVPERPAQPQPQLQPQAIVPRDLPDYLKPDGIGKKISHVFGMIALASAGLSVIGGIGYGFVYALTRNQGQSNNTSSAIKNPLGVVSAIPKTVETAGTCTKPRAMTEGESNIVGGLVGTRKNDIQFCTSATAPGDDHAIRVTGDANKLADMSKGNPAQYGAFIEGISHAFISKSAKPCTPEQMKAPYTLNREAPLSSLCAELQDKTVMLASKRFLHAVHATGSTDAFFSAGQQRLTNETTLRIVAEKGVPEFERTRVAIKAGKMPAHGQK